MATKLYVGGLSYNTKNEGLEELFASQGTVVSANIIIDKMSNRSKGFGFVEMETAEEAKAAIDNLNGKEFDGRTITVNMAREKTEGERRGHGRRDNGNSSFRFR